MPSYLVLQDNVVLTLAIAFCCDTEFWQSFLCAFGAYKCFQENEQFILYDSL